LNENETPESAGADKVTFPENLFRLVSVIVKVPDAPRLNWTNDGLEEIVKSGDGMKTETTVEWEIVVDPIVVLPVVVNV